MALDQLAPKKSCFPLPDPLPDPLLDPLLDSLLESLLDSLLESLLDSSFERSALDAGHVLHALLRLDLLDLPCGRIESRPQASVASRTRARRTSAL